MEYNVEFYRMARLYNEKRLTEKGLNNAVNKQLISEEEKELILSGVEIEE